MEVGDVAAPPTVKATVHKDPNAGDPRSGQRDPSDWGRVESLVDETRDHAYALSLAAVALGRTRDAEEVVRVDLAETQ